MAETEEINDLRIWIAKGMIWMKLARMEEEIEYRIKDKYRRKYRFHMD